MSFTFLNIAAACGLFAGILLCFELGRRTGIARLALDKEGLTTGTAPIEAAIFGLLGLLLAFTFSGAAERFDQRRHLITEEANIIETAFLRVDLLPADSQPEIRALFRRYAENRAEAYRDATDPAATAMRLATAVSVQNEIWEKSLAAIQRPGTAPAAATLLLPALNTMIDMTTTREVALESHPPMIIYVLLAVLSLVSALLTGYIMCTTRVRSWFYLLLLAATLSLTQYVILDLEYPRRGMIRIDSADHVFRDLKRHMN